jgi:hypothetical protein
MGFLALYASSEVEPTTSMLAKLLAVVFRRIICAFIAELEIFKAVSIDIVLFSIGLG